MPTENHAERFAIILAAQRSGTNLLREILDTTGRVCNLGEVFEERYAVPNATCPQHYPLEYPKVNYFRFLVDQVRGDPERAIPFSGNLERLLDQYLAHLSAAALPDRRLLIDIKYCSTHHLNGFWKGLHEEPNLLRMIRSRNIPIIHVLRKNIFHLATSNMIAYKTNCFHHRRNDPPLQREKIELNPAEVVHEIANVKAEVLFFRRHLEGYPLCCEIQYDDLVSDEQGFQTNVRARLESCLKTDLAPSMRQEYLRGASALQKITPPLSQIIENFQEVIDTVRETEFAQHL